MLFLKKNKNKMANEKDLFVQLNHYRYQLNKGQNIHK